MGLSVFINGALATRDLEVIIDDRVASDREFGMRLLRASNWDS